MSLEINTTLTKKQEDTEADCHLLPVTLKYDGPAKVSSYFTPIIHTKDSILSASFRGRPLLGKTVELPENYKGLVLKKSDKELNATASFSKFTYWKWDLIPSEGDSLKQSLNWLDISEAVHSSPQETDKL